MAGLKGRLALRINDGMTNRVVTHFCSGLKFTKTAPGGHQRISFGMTLPRSAFADLGGGDMVALSDARTARSIFDGYLENPTPVDGPGGQSYAISAVGGMALASDETRALMYVDKALDGWNQVQYGSAHPDSSAGQYTDPDSGVSGLRDQLPRGLVLVTNSVAAVDYRAMDRAGMQIAGVRIVTKSGKTDSGYRVQLYDFTAATNIGDTGQMSTTAYDQTQWIGVSITTGATKVLVQLNRTGAGTNVADDTTWTNLTGVSVLGRRMDRNGVLLTTAAAHGNTALSVLASQVVEDLLGRLLTFCDPTVAQVDATTYPITQLTYPDGAKASGVLDDLAVYEADLLWEILDALPNGLHRFNYRAWPTKPRYEISVKDGWSQTGSDVDLCNRILVTWTDATGAKQVTTVTADDAGLTDPLPGRIKDADPVTLPDGHGSEDNALRIGTQILADKITPPVAGVATVRRPILDHYTGCHVMPWEIEPGYPCRVRELGIDLRLTQVDYDDDTASMQLTLGTPVLTDEQRLARLETASSSIHITA